MALTKVTYSMINGAPVNVLDFGAVGDGVTDDTDAIQNAINTGQNLYFPSGEYLCNVTISEFFEWQGAGMTNSVLKPYNSSLPVVTNLYQEPDWRATSISDIGFESTSALTGIGFSYGDPAGYTAGQELIGRVIFNRCSFKGFDKAVFKNYGNIGNVYNQCYFQSNNYGSYAIDAELATGGVSPIMQADTDTWNGGEFHDNQIAAVCVLENAIPTGQLVFNQTVMEFNPGFAVYWSAPNCGSITPAAFNEVWFEGNATATTVTIPVVSGGVVTPTVLTPKTVSIDPTQRAFNFFSGGSGYNGIGTVAPNAPLGVWGDNRTAINLITEPTVGHWTRIAFANEGTETTVGASISSYLISGTSQNVIIGAGSQDSFAVQPNGSVQIGTPAVTGATPVDGSHQIYSTVATEGTHILDINGRFQGASAFYVASGGTPNAAATALSIYKNSTTNRSINAGGTVNASGADYAEYMVKCGDFTIEKGDICGINAEGKLTNVFADAVTFVVKSTDPSYVGGDTWGGKPLGEEPYTEEELEEIRQTVDRIAFAGKVPVNATNATAGDYIVPVLGSDGGIEGVSISNPTFEQYKIAVGKVISVDLNGKPTIIVKVA